MTCEEFRAKGTLLAHSLTRGERAALASHVQACESCYRYSVADVEKLRAEQGQEAVDQAMTDAGNLFASDYQDPEYREVVDGH